MNNKRIDLSSVVALLVVSVFACISYFNQDNAMNIIRVVLENGYLKSAIVIGIVVIIVTHSIRVKSKKDNGVFIIKSGFKPLDVFLSCGTYIAVSSTACSLMEGAFVQQFFGDIQYFTQFSNLDVYVLLGVASLLIWYVVFHMYTLAGELVFNASEVSPSDKNMHNNGN